MFRDETEIEVRAGAGGNGCVSFRREKFVPKGGPDGGDGGDGGSVILEAHEGRNTLFTVGKRHLYKAEKGRQGEGSNMTGRRGTDEVIQVPVGTQVLDRDTGYLLRDLKVHGERVCVAKGGRGGRGNKHYASSLNQTPRQATAGLDGEERKLRLTLKLIADVGLAGLPNAGKSTLLSRLSNARPKIADYPFTTLKPSLGIVDAGGYSTFVMADIPGLIEGAHEGAGLGDTFLKHIERTRIVLQMVDLCPPEGEPSPIEAFHIIRKELASYSPLLAEKPVLVAGNKLDVPEAQDNLAEFAHLCPARVLPISAVTGKGLPPLVHAINALLDDSES